MTRLRIGVVGLGIGRLHVLALLRLRSHFELVAVADPAPARRRQARLLGIKAVPDLDSLLALGLDVVDICTPPHLHEQQIIQCLEAGTDVVCEKPLVDSVAAVDRLAEAEARTGRRVAPIFQYRWGAGSQKLKRLIDAGIPGRLLVATSETMWKRGDAYYAVPWRGTWAGERGGAVLSHAIHLHDLLTWLGGAPAEVVARTTTRSFDIEVEDCAAAVITTDDGALMTATVTLGAAVETSRLRFVFEHLTVESSQSPYKPGAEPWTFHYGSKDVARRAEAALAAWTPPLSGWRGQLAATHDAIVSGGPLPVSLDDARTALEIVTAWYGSARSGLPQALPLAADHPDRASWLPEDLRER
ncbi:Gfo/Idh/MocA family protein [Aquihabitans sp. McL0605]|uniref:Gfo/Idh/MocA family protein n=1 Tax=Aquihabitans sp. McL0605 TaxID=3415671 RepID=UPI003CEF0458